MQRNLFNNDADEIPIKEINLNSNMRLGAGAHGEVFRIFQNCSFFAVKKTYRKKENATLPQEIVIMQSLAKQADLSPSIVKLYGYSFDNQLTYLIMEYVPHTLYWMYSNTLQPASSVLCKMTLQLLTALHYIHGKGILHCDIKSDNVLLTENYSVKLCDFSLATYISTPRSRGPAVCWRAPELILFKKSDTMISTKSDVFSFGITLYEIFNWKFPFDRSCTGDQVEKKIVNNDLPLIDSHHLLFIEKIYSACTKSSAKDRPDAANILKKYEKYLTEEIELPHKLKEFICDELLKIESVNSIACKALAGK